jgi:septal ring-binding cell division protein DamX
MKIALLLLAANLFAQAQGERMSIAFRDPARPGTVKMNILHGSIAVKAHSGKDVQVESTSRSEKETERDVPESAKGLKRLSAPSSSITREEENNTVTISLGWKSRSENITIYVPTKTSLKLSATNGRMLTVEGVEGDMELNATNGGIQLTDVSGSVVAHALNGKIVAKFKAVDPTKPMSFSSMNGTIDVTLPASLKANLKMQTAMGDVFTDFDVKMQPTSTKVEKAEPKPGERTRNRIRMETVTLGAINGGGPDYSFKNFNGNIYIRKAN